MKQFEAGEITRVFYLLQMGAIRLKADKTGNRMVPDLADNIEEQAAQTTEAEGVEVPVKELEFSDGGDSLSETRPLPPRIRRQLQ